MSTHRKRLAGALLAAVLAAATAVTGGEALAAPEAPAAAAPSYTVTVGAKGSWTHPDDTPAAPYLDKDGTFHFQQAHSLYGANDGRAWTFFTGKDLDSATRDGALSDAVDPAESRDRNNDTTWRCNNSPPAGSRATRPPVRATRRRTTAIWRACGSTRTPATGTGWSTTSSPRSPSATACTTTRSTTPSPRTRGGPGPSRTM
ncbi:hypothetical protein [Streptomyces sp. SAT1]|uniref:hypothetical protein n=1 Tax=Streptomyces sp. SAT1 TaxID=1849967 RepID=UPI001F38B169|nr:hypothetical protein [Streptomyces sp. SAT1]